ncbi:MAG TPA: DUF3099 domain-containing protein [Pilimelia sp.]|nr:DUF3099 domain-containing protein [Pilimelia sp.]
MKRQASRPVLITDAERSQDEQLRSRQIRYVTMMATRVVFLVLGGILISARVPMLWLWLILCAFGMTLLPWLAVIIANDRPPKERYRLSARFRRRHTEPAPPRSLPAQEPNARTIDAEQ